MHSSSKSMLQQWLLVWRHCSLQPGTNVACICAKAVTNSMLHMLFSASGTQAVAHQACMLQCLRKPWPLISIECGGLPTGLTGNPCINQVAEANVSIHLLLLVKLRGLCAFALCFVVP